jgi:hypothetical protein
VQKLCACPLYQLTGVSRLLNIYFLMIGLVHAVCIAEVRLEQAHREAAAFRARCQKVGSELSQLKIDHAAALVSGVNQRDGDGWQMNNGPKRSRFCAIM